MNAGDLTTYAFCFFQDLRAYLQRRCAKGPELPVNRRRELWPQETSGADHHG